MSALSSLIVRLPSIVPQQLVNVGYFEAIAILKLQISRLVEIVTLCKQVFVMNAFTKKGNGKTKAKETAGLV